MKQIKHITALAAAFLIAASLTAGGSFRDADTQTLETPAKASLSAADDMSPETEVTSASSEEVSSLDKYAGEYTMFGLGDMEMNFQNKKVVVDNEGQESGSVTLNGDGTGLMTDGSSGEEVPVTGWSADDGSITITCEGFGFSGVIEDGVINIGYEGSSDTLYFAREDADLSAWSIVSEDEYETYCMAGTYYLTNETMADGSTFLNRTQITLNVLNGLGEASLKLYEDGTGALDVGDHRDLTWDIYEIVLNGQEYDLDLEDGVITVDMKDYTMEFTYIGEGDVYLQLNLEDIQDSVSAIPGSFAAQGETGIMIYVPSTYTSMELTDANIADGYVSRNVEMVDADGDNFYDNAIYVTYYYDDELSSFELLVKEMEALEDLKALYPIMINGRFFLYLESSEDVSGSFHYYEFFAIDDHGYTTRISYIFENGITAEYSRELVYMLAAAIYPAG